MTVITKERIVELILDAIEEFNPQLPPEQQLERSKDTILFGKSGKLDSLALVSLIVSVEQKIEEEMGVSITLVDENAVSQKKSPFKTVETLANYIVSILRR